MTACDTILILVALVHVFVGVAGRIVAPKYMYMYASKFISGVRAGWDRCSELS